ncbi:MAG: DUF5655 domain-containing protein [Dehalococcoidia bacterium]
MTETTIFVGVPRAEALYEVVRAYIESLGGDVRVEPKRTQISFKAKTGFAYVWRPQVWGIKRPEDSIVLSFDAGRKIEDARIEESTEARPGRWVHHVLIEKKGDLDATVKRWLREAYAFGQIDRRKGRKTPKS